MRDLAEAFVFTCGYDVPSIVRFTFDPPDGERALRNALDARLLSADTLVRGPSARTTISPTAR